MLFAPQPNIMLQQMRISLALNQRKVYLCDLIDEDNVFECMYYLNRIMEYDKKFCDTKEPIELYIDSCGGYVSSGMTLVSMIESMKDDGYKIITVTNGKAYSMAFVVAVCGSERRCYRYATFMTHDASCGFYPQKVKETEEYLDFVKVLRNQSDSVILKYTDITESQIEDWINHKKDKYFTSEEALKLKIVDKIV